MFGKLKNFFASDTTARLVEPNENDISSSRLFTNFCSYQSYNGGASMARKQYRNGGYQDGHPNDGQNGGGSNPMSNQHSSYEIIGDPNLNQSLVNNQSGGGKTSLVMGAFLLINAALGAGLLNYPVAYDRLGGIFYATIIQFFAAALMISTILALVYCSHITNQSSYHGVMKVMCGKIIMQLSAVSIAITCFGICVTFIIIIGDQFDRIFATYVGSDFCSRWWANRYFTMSATAIIVSWPMCYFRRLDFLRHVNVLGVMASFYIIFLNIYTYFTHQRDNPNDIPIIRTSPESAFEFIAALPVVFFAYQTHEIVIPVYESMSIKHIKVFSKSVMIAMSALLVLYCLAGSFGYLTFGSKVAPDIMLMFNAKDPIILAGIVALIVKMVTTYPPVLFCGRDTIVRLILSRLNGTQQQQQQYECLNENDSHLNSLSSLEKYVNIIVTTFWNIVVLFLALVIPNITIAIGFLGSLASCNVFIFPGLALLALVRRFARLQTNNQNSIIGSSSAINNYNNNNQNFHHDLTQHRTSNEQMEQTNNNSNNQNSDYQNRVSNEKWLSLNRRSIQRLLQAYSLFIIGMGLVMFVIILIQVYHDFQLPQKPHGVVCDAPTFSQQHPVHS